MLMFFLNLMTSRKITIDSSVKYIAESEQNQERERERER